ncbi:MAG: UDP-N-acetylmuramate--L-alanine ligase [Ruminococcaceae bacterium]|nr:UDP-N-acetylmuramate--L-alanine ligase [Oscillospiraceae bacterium]
MAISNTHFSSDEIHKEFTRAEKIFFIGIGGISMSALAEFCARAGKQIFGYDRVRGKESVRLERMGKIKYYSTPDNITGMDMVIYTNAIDENNFEYRRAKKLKLPLISRANFLGYVVQLHKVQIGISGMHGKSTTTAMLGHIFDEACQNPTVFCGAEMNSFGSNCKLGGRECCIFEACEYQNSFLSLPTTDAVVLNIDFDHPDFFSGIEEIKSSFNKYIKNAKRVFVNYDDESSRELCHKNIITFGFNKNSVFRAEICENEKTDTGLSFFVYKRGDFLCKCTICAFGTHMVYDALCAFAVASTYGIGTEVICKALSTFKGSRRRMEFIKKNDTGADVFEDYAHHPTEIKSSLEALTQMGYKKILCVFQPHTFSRTYYLYDRFTSSFSLASELIIAPSYSAREENVFELSEEKFAIDCRGEFVQNIEKIAHRVGKSECDCVVLMGAGDLSAKLIPLI